MDNRDKLDSLDNLKKQDYAKPGFERGRNCEMIHLATVYPPEDIFLESVLKQAGITVVKFKESIGVVEGICFGPLAEIKIFVPKHQEEEARDIIASLTTIIE